MTRSPQTSPTPAVPADDTTATGPTRARRRWPFVAAATAAAVAVAGGAVAYADARKTVTLDVDGDVRTVTSYSDSVDDLLGSQGVTVDDRDLVTPAAGSDLEDGADIVVRTGKELDLQVDGKRTDAWVTALDAAEALDTLTARGPDVRIVASRDGERASLPVDVDTDGPVAVVHDGSADVVEGADDVEAVLAEADVKLGDKDRVHVTDAANGEVKKHVATAVAQEQKQAAKAGEKAGEKAGTAGATVEQAAAQAPAAPQVAVVVQRVETKKVTTTRAVDHKTVTKKSASRYSDLDAKVATKGKDGERTIVNQVTTVDGKVVKKTKVSDKITTKPVTGVLVKGTKERPEPEPKEPTYSGSTRSIGQQMAAARGWSGSQWTCLESLWTKESGWNASAANPSSGAYGIPQALPGSKMATAGSDWATNPATQIEWGLDYISGRYGTPCGAWGHSQSVGWY
ncbi:MULTISPECIES: aggregation-promoting factor C-terminal-like domain-containing protein [unclassified Isoptericola]|uniref:aggregation-promoting factor C-terminal-like domain-containing protein n=1 Tax=unclassified Isoptericola TaxID=2623355 RepID=UPI00366863CE